MICACSSNEPPTPAPSGSARATGPVVRVGDPSLTGTLDKGAVRRAVRRNIEPLTTCYQTALAAKPGLAGMVEVDFTIAVDGTATAAKATGVDDTLAACIAKAIGAIRFPRPAEGLATPVKLPLALRPDPG